MKIGIFSDSHDHEVNIRKIAEIFASEKIDAIFHCGDMVSPFIFRWLDPIKDKGIPGYAVFGNNDGELQYLIKALKPFFTITGHLNTCVLGGIKIAMTHGHLEDLLNTIIDSGVYDLVLTGHTHKVVNEMRGNTLVVNPGESCGYLFGPPTYAIIKFEANCPPKPENVKILNP